ncbi:terminase large subunit domain-containing protein [Streptomyces boetiae]|nr:terminase family protein [Streptomyces sp. DSM 44917]
MWAQPRAVVSRPHLSLIASAFKQAAIAPGGRLLITTPPQVGKSLTAATYGPAWYLLRHPGRRIAIGTYADALAHRRGRDVRDVIAEHGHRWGVGIRRGSASVADWETTAGGGLRSVGVGSALTGFPADFLLVDDPHKDRAAADSRRQREAVWDWWSAVATSRLSPGAPAVLIMTRWHDDDLAGRLLAREGRAEDGGRWHVIHLEAIHTGKHGPDPLGRAVGDPLPHPKVAEGGTAALLSHWEDKRRGSTARDWAGLYQGDPQPAEGALVTAALLAERRVPYGQALPAPERVAVAVDPSGGGRDEAGIIGGYLGADRLVYLTHDWSGVMGSDRWARTACLLAVETDADRIVVEKNFGGDMCRQMINTAWQALHQEGRVPAGRSAPFVAEETAKRGKALRAEPVAQALVEGRVWLADDLPELAREWATWQPTSSESPGRLDASVYLVKNLAPHVPPYVPSQHQGRKLADISLKRDVPNTPRLPDLGRRWWH